MPLSSQGTNEDGQRLPLNMKIWVKKWSWHPSTLDSFEYQIEQTNISKVYCKPTYNSTCLVKLASGKSPTWKLKPIKV